MLTNSRGCAEARIVNEPILKTLTFFLLTICSYGQSVYQGDFYVREVYQDTSYCERQFVLFGFKADTAAFKIAGKLYIFTGSTMLHHGNDGPIEKGVYGAFLCGVPYTLTIIVGGGMIIMITSNRRGYFPHFVISTNDVCPE